ncbi:hypothetical protein PRO82_001271 [Candidatus Protochlamydia amoebophila]|nr:hypothetical protein [Candidatus Protochlamydia amoebophila]
MKALNLNPTNITALQILINRLEELQLLVLVEEKFSLIEIFHNAIGSL